MDQPDQSNKRRFERSKLILPIRYLNLNSQQEGHGQMRDISDKGVGLVTKDELPVNTPLEMWLVLPNGGCIYLKGTVAWCAQMEEGVFAIGVNLGEEELHSLQIVIRAIGSVGGY